MLPAVPPSGARLVPTADRLRAVSALLDRRADAVRRRDAAAFLATVEPEAGGFRDRQAALAGALASVPLAEWSYAVAPESLRQRDRTRWAGRVTLTYRLQGVDDQPVVATQYLLFVQRGAGWLLAADDVAGLGGRTDRAVWDEGPVVAVRGRRSLVLGHPGSSGLQELAAELDAAAPRVTAAWGSDWEQQVAAIVPSSAAELARLAPGSGDLTSVAALALVGRGPAGARILVNPATFPQLSPAGRRIVLTHELTHVATRRATGPVVPAWLVEGLADDVGYEGAGVPVAEAAAELQADVRAGRLPDRLPDAADFAGPAAAQAYQQAWLAVRLLRATYGRQRLLALYRSLGAAPAGDPAAALDRALHDELGTSTAALTASWRVALQDRLS